MCYEAGNSVLGVRASREQPFTQEKPSYPLLVDQGHYQLVCVEGEGVFPGGKSCSYGFHFACYKVEWSNNNKGTDRTVKSWEEQGEGHV